MLSCLKLKCCELTVSDTVLCLFLFISVILHSFSHIKSNRARRYISTCWDMILILSIVLCVCVIRTYLRIMLSYVQGRSCMGRLLSPFHMRADNTMEIPDDLIKIKSKRQTNETRSNTYRTIYSYSGEVFLFFWIFGPLYNVFPCVQDYT